jgi:dimeric dUTPase (all-alpha-NTP-PPase superfamily)
VTKEMFREMLEAQEHLNIRYKGETWRELISGKKIEMAIFTEIAEFLESSPEEWKWWKSDLNDRQNQYIEVIDVVHFGLTMLLRYNKNIEDIVSSFNYEDIYKLFKNSENQGISNAMINFFDCPDVSTFYTLIISLCQFPEKPLFLEEVWRGYFEKNKLNIERIEGGYSKGKYQKINEKGEEDNRRIEFER